MATKYASFSKCDWLSGAGAVLVWATIAGWAGLLHAAGKSSSQLEAPTHRQVRTITPTVDGKSVKLHTLATNQDGNLIVALGGQSMTFDQSGGSFKPKMVEEPGVIQMIDSEGEVLKQWEIDMTPSSLGIAPDGTIYVGGSGRIVQLDQDGSIARSIDSPHIGDVDEFRKKTADAFRKSMSGMSATYESQIETLKERIAAIEEKDEDDRSKLEDAQLKAFETQLEMFEDLVGNEEEDSEGSMMSSQIDYMVHQSMLVTSLAVSDQDVFACASGGGLGGYSVWRISRDLDPDSATVVKEGLSGCCGQMDIQCCEGNLLVSENTRFKVGIYDRDGERITDFGGRDRSSRAGFGSCCNPMNSLSLPDGTILTAESSIGHIKRFDTDGNLVSYIGKASIGGGCKHCALGYDESKDLYYMMSQDKNAICVLANIDSSPLTVAEKELLKRQTEFLARAAGDWKMEDVKEKKSSLGGAIVSLFGGGRGGSSPHPIASLKVGSDGSAKILEGMYQAYGDDAQIELIPSEDAEISTDENTFSFALAIDQVRFLEGSWTFAGDDTTTLAFTGHQPVTLLRSDSSETCESHCDGKDCADPNCKEENCPQQTAVAKVAAAKVVPMKVADVKEVTPAEPPRRYATYDSSVEPDTALKSDPVTHQETFSTIANISTVIPKPTFSYKLISPKNLGRKPEKTLNKMGADGWEFCGKVGKEMLFKRIDKYEMSEAKQ